MKLGPYYHRNQQKLALITSNQWEEALARSIRYIELKLRRKTLYGAHAGSRLGAEAVDHYVSFAYEKIISGEWDFKDDRDIAEQMIRIIGSTISKVIKHSKTEKAEAFKVEYVPIEDEFYEREIDSGEQNAIYEKMYELMVDAVDEAVEDDIELVIIWDAIKEGKTRSDIAALLDKDPRQFDKLRDKLIKTVKNQQLVG
jgi:hypothetical protein